MKPTTKASIAELGGETVCVVDIDLAASLPDCLSEAERDVALYTLMGHTNEEIAAARGTSPNTVANQLASLFEKIGVNSRFEFARVMTLGCVACGFATSCTMARLEAR